MVARGLRNGGDRNNIKDWQYFVSNWFCLEDPNINRTITPRPCNHDPEPIPTCSESIPLQMEVSIPSEGITKSPTAVASFLGYGRDSDQPAFKSIAVTLDGRLKVQSAGGDSFLYAAVAAEDPSLIYLYSEAEVTGNFSYLKCSILDEHLVCNHDDRSAVLSCGNAPVIVFRLSKTVGEGCHEVTFSIKIRTDICIPPTATSAGVHPTPTTTAIRTCIPCPKTTSTTTTIRFYRVN